ncbi:MAG: hypothetical protein ACR2HX_19435 [Pyrinomonadaceae bacterium]
MAQTALKKARVIPSTGAPLPDPRPTFRLFLVPQPSNHLGVTAEDIIEEARNLIGVKFRIGGVDPAQGLDHIGFALVGANRLGLVSASVLERYSRDYKKRFGFVRCCVEMRRFWHEIPENAVPRIGDAAMLLMVDSEGNENGETIAIITSLDPLILISLSPQGVVEWSPKYSITPTRFFRIRNQESERREEEELINSTKLWARLLGIRIGLGLRIPVSLFEWKC